MATTGPKKNEQQQIENFKMSSEKPPFCLIENHT
jgi:hypothetical protein